MFYSHVPWSKGEQSWNNWKDRISQQRNRSYKKSEHFKNENTVSEIKFHMSLVEQR